MNTEEIRKELIRILIGSNSNDYMWYYDGDEWTEENSGQFRVLDSLIALINKLNPNEEYVHDHYVYLPKKEGA